MYIAKEEEKIDKHWNEMLYLVCKGDAGQMRELMRFDIFDFFAFIGNYEKQMKDGKRS